MLDDKVLLIGAASVPSAMRRCGVSCTQVCARSAISAVLNVHRSL